MYYLLIVLLCLIGRGESITHISKVHRLNDGPLPRDLFVAASCGNSAYVFGGVIGFEGNGSYIPFNDLWRLDVGIVANWVQLFPQGPVPSARALYSAGVIVGPGYRPHLAIFGGALFTDMGLVGFAQDTFYLYDIEYNIYLDLTSLLGPGPRGGSLGVAVGRHLYVIGGFVLQGFLPVATREVWRFDGIALTWTRMADLPLDPPGGVLQGDKLVDGTIVVHSGGALDIATFNIIENNETWAYDIDSDSWERRDPQNTLPVRVFGASLASPIRPVLRTFFGDTPGGCETFPPGHTINVSDEIWIYRKLLNRWNKETVLGKAPAIRNFGAFSVGVFGYITGGWFFDCDTLTQTFNMDVYRVLEL